ncbi:MAG: CAP domain-containing protein [Pseudomonadota bacterium]
MNIPNRGTTLLAALATAWALAACGGGGGSTSEAPAPVVVAPAPIVLPPSNPSTPAPTAGAPASVGNVAADGRNWINYRRDQIGMPRMTQNAQIDRAAQAHSDYQRLNDEITHDEVAGKAGFTGVKILDRLNAASFSFNQFNSYAYGEVISATSNNSGFYMVDELITAIYHRFVIFEPSFKEVGTGSGTTARGYTYFTADFAANNGYGAGIVAGSIVTWPFSDQAGVTPNFFSDYEEPDPVCGQNEVGYPISVHANIDATVTVQTFTVQARGGSPLRVKLLDYATDLTSCTGPAPTRPKTPPSAASIIPLDVLRGATTYDVRFTGAVNGVAVTRNWSFTTR